MDINQLGFGPPSGALIGALGVLGIPYFEIKRGYTPLNMLLAQPVIAGRKSKFIMSLLKNHNNRHKGIKIEK